MGSKNDKYRKLRNSNGLFIIKLRALIVREGYHE